MTSESTNSKANGNIGMNELSAVELDAVSGGMTALYNFKVAGMQIQGAYDPVHGIHVTVVEQGGRSIVRMGMVL